MSNNKSRFYASLLDSFIYPDYIKYIRDSLSSYYNIKFESSNDNRIKINVKFNFFDLIYKKIIDKNLYHLKVNIYIVPNNLINTISTNEVIRTYDHTEDNKFSMSIYPYTNLDDKYSKSIDKSIESLNYSPYYFIDNSLIGKSRYYNRFCNLRYKRWKEYDSSKVVEDFIRLNNFIDYIRDTMIPKLCEMWYESLPIIFQQ